MSDCCCCDNDNNEVRLVEYSIVSVKRCDERILDRGNIIDAENMGDDGLATWVLARYLQDHHIPRDDQKYLRVYTRVLQTWPRQHYDCCDNREIDVLRGIEDAIRNLSANWRREEGREGGGERTPAAPGATPAPATS